METMEGGCLCGAVRGENEVRHEYDLRLFLTGFLPCNKRGSDGPFPATILTQWKSTPLLMSKREEELCFG
jgi:hypothetical protein